MIMPDDTNELDWIPANFEWQWKTWINEIADDLEFRGAWTQRPWNLRQVIDIFGSVTKAANKPLFFSGYCWRRQKTMGIPPSTNRYDS